MTPFSLRSLLLAAIFLSNCITWTLSRHHYKHNVNGHRSRHRRQGAGLFLSASYVIPGGEGSGWGEWGEVSPCSRTCGGGVASQKRICLQVGPDGQPQCSGGDTKYFSCQTQDCPAGSKDFRSQQCSEYDDQLFRDRIQYNWVPYLRESHPCELNCMPRAERFYYRHKEKVIDGTRCNDDSFDVCVNGTCQPVGCDMMLGSNAREDKCRECRGHNANCHTTSGLLDTQDLRKGYNDILLIPEGSTTIVIYEIAPSNNYLALRAKNNTFYLNGDYHIDFPRNLVIAGALWTYERSQQGFAAPDKLRTPGPTNEPLYLAVLLQDENVGIQYEYSLPKDKAPPQNKRYNWVHDQFTPCSASCGGGFQTRNVTCRSREELDIVDETLCDDGLRPPTNQSCSTHPCDPQWAPGAWGPCSKHCGKGGARSREVTCQKIISNGYPSIVADSECFDRLGPKPKLHENCNENATCPTWFTGPWKPCDKLCDQGKQTRQVVCYQKNGRKVEVLSEDQCEDERPPAEQSCMLQPCDGVDWVVSPWNGCDSCLSKFRTRTLKCATKSHEVIDDQYCSYHPTPSTKEPCDPSLLPPCDVQWYATQWSNCSTICGKGLQSRKVFCGIFDGASVRSVADSRCDGQPKYNETKPCEVPKDKCPSQFFASKWTACDKIKCQQYRKVMCLRGGERATDCPTDVDVPPSFQDCDHCKDNEDDLLPVDSNTPGVMDDYEDCEEDELYPEAGLDDDTDSGITPYDTMFSDGSSGSTDTGSGWTSVSYEPESNFTDDSSLTTDELFSVTGPGSTDTLYTDDTSDTEETGSGSSTLTTVDDTESTVFTSSSSSEETDSTEASVSTTELLDASTTESGSSASDDTSATDSTVISSSSSPEETDSTSSGSSIDLLDGSTTESGSTASDDTSVSDGDSTELTSSVVSTDSESTTVMETSETSETRTTETIESGPTETTDDSSTEFSTDGTSTTESDTTEATETSGSTEPSGSTESGPTDTSEISTTDATETTETATDNTSSTDASETDHSSTEIGSTTDLTETDGTTESGPTETTELSETGSTETTETSDSSTEPSDTTETSSTETTETGSSEPTETSETDLTETTETGSTEPTETGSTEPTETGSTEATETGSTEPTETGSTEFTVTGSTEPTETGSTETTETGSTETTETGSTETTETGSTETTETGSTETTETGSTETTETGSTEPTETDETGSTETSETAETGSTESSSTVSSETEDTSESSTTESEGLTSSVIEWITTKKPRMCRPRMCKFSEFGCCPDGKTAAGGPFDEGCDKPRTCKLSTHGCCPDGVSPAQGPKQKGCPVPRCEETLFGCCESDNKTAAGGNDQEDCPPPPPPCKSSKYGCCKDEQTEATGPGKEGCPETTAPPTEPTTVTTAVYEGCEKSSYGCCFDNATEATGPNQQGCPCDTTEFGCCLDGVSAAQGPDLEGCLKDCNSSAYGCCPDNKSPAHGPNKEGCCLRSAFGCCPDNYNYARGPHLEECGCQYSPYGCCPDNVTSASGYDNKGCGCSFTTNGCCPDGHTEASGPDFEGCLCNTYQFGCCPDGVTIARGPGGQGCHCLQSQFKCCGDGETHATGPNQQGCDCSSSKFGCCPDGRTEATGARFHGCTDAPENKQAACALKFERGPCRNYSVYWYFDTEYGGCSRFWYGGCEGNGNKFPTKEECDDTCVSPPPKDACKLPSSKGACNAYNIHWYYDSERESCSNFQYGGCLGNNNNFETREACQKQCEPEKTTEQCSLPIEQGSCSGNFPRWGYNKDSKRCEPFVWGGCEGNPNRFSTEAACNLRCNPPGQPKPECSQPQDAGSCNETEALWSFSQSENRCVPFYYTGCGGNDNKFRSKEACEDSCPSAYVPDKCTIPYETGNCANYRVKWYFDTKDQRCRQFYYGGCGGNENKFDSELQCQSECQPLPSTTTTTTTTVRPTSPSQQQPGPQPDRQDFCFLEMDAGPCDRFKTAWAYDSRTGRCTTFQYGGCGGNRNNFPDEQYCQYYCKASQDICQLPMLSGPCEESQMRWFYDQSSDSCSQFTYGGCEGNENRFESRDECENRCKTGASAEQTTVSTTTTVSVDSRLGEECATSPKLEPCSPDVAGQVWYLNPSTHECIPHDNSPDGDQCRVSGVFKTQEGCERSCGAFRGIDVCAYDVDPGRCTNYVAKYFFNASSNRCEQFAYGGCVGGPNRFSTELECQDICRPSVDPCKQQPDPGNCLARFEQWYYDEARDQCAQFIYGGCGGNENRFDSRDACEGRCKKPDVTTVRPTQTTDPECLPPPSLDPCGVNETVFYYDESTSSCRAAGIGGCRHANSYATEEECERRCGAFRGLDVCRAQVNPGPCRAAFSKYYFDFATGSCQQFTYGGCQGGPNRFSTLEECEDVCKEVGPAPACLPPVDVGEACEGLTTRRWYYSPVRADCLVFAYQGCGGNENNFGSYADCVELCKVQRPVDEAQAALCEQYSEECEALESTCDSIKVTVATEGCQRCSCEPSCEREKQECERIRCPYGVQRTAGDNGCERCSCSTDDPCSTANCSSNERCVAYAYRDPITQNAVYTAHCVPETDTNEVLPECEQDEAHCASLSCPYGVQRSVTPRGCVRCTCVQEEVNCDQLRQECDELKCNYGVERSTGEDGCERCKCQQHPCDNKPCPDGERCVPSAYREPVSQETRYLAECRIVEKPGACPADTARSTESTCRNECGDDADCRGVGKCCSRGCSRLCLAPEEPSTPAPVTQHVTYSPDAPQAPQGSTETEPEVTAQEGGLARLSCIFHGNPPPRITWRFGEITIDSDRDRYRLRSDGALEIVSLYRNDSGVYICVAENELGSASQEIRLQVNDPVEGPATIAGEPNAVLVGELNSPLAVRCRAYGYPAPSIYWYRGINGPMVPYSNALYEARDTILTIRSLAVETLGEYACFAYNGHGKPATWVVTVQAYQPDDNAIGGKYLVPNRVVEVTPREPTTRSTTTQRPEIQTLPPYIVEVHTELLPASSTVSAGAELSLPCNVDGYPEPTVTWTKDSAQLAPSDRIWITGTRLTIQRAVVSDSGVYGCHASNRYSEHSSTVQISVQEMVIPSKCTDSPYFANCALIVQGKFCRHKYYSRFCCKSCVQAGQLDPSEAEMQADEAYRKK